MFRRLPSSIPCAFLCAVVVMLAPQKSLAEAYKFTATPASAPLVYFHIVDVGKVPKSFAEPAARRDELVDADADPRAAALTNPFAGFLGDAAWSPEAVRTQLLSASPGGTPGGVMARGFEGMREGYKTAVGRPDQSIAVGPQGILQSINSKLALYDRTGALRPGWPKEASRVFGLPASNYMVDPRAEYDTWDHRYWLAFLNQEALGVIFLAVSKTSNPNGQWYVYGFNCSPPPNLFDDFTMFGLDQTTVSLTAHIGYKISPKHYTDSNAVFILPKAALESGAMNIAGTGFIDIALNGTNLDTFQPVMVQTVSGTPPPTELFASTYGFNFSCYDDQGGPCQQMFLVGITVHGSHASLSHAVVKVPPYAFAPPADTPLCIYCIEAVGPMMTTPPVYERGIVDLAFGLGTPSDQPVGVASIFWAQLQPAFSGSRLTSAKLVQDGVVGFPGDQAATFPSVMANAAGDFFLMFDSMGPALNPSMFVSARHANDPPGVMTSTLMLRGGLAPPEEGQFVYGDYTAASADPSGGIWFASEYGRSPSVYGTYIANVHL